jgi:hypothetical protein
MLRPVSRADLVVNDETQPSQSGKVVTLHSETRIAIIEIIRGISIRATFGAHLPQISLHSLCEIRLQV